jgi:hypothetical protein
MHQNEGYEQEAGAGCYFLTAAGRPGELLLHPGLTGTSLFEAGNHLIGRSSYPGLTAAPVRNGLGAAAGKLLLHPPQ